MAAFILAQPSIANRALAHVASALTRSVSLQLPHGPAPASLQIEQLPYPANAPDPDIFEQDSPEYHPSSSALAAPTTTTQTLAALVANNKYSAAAALRREILASGQHITPDRIYEKAAIHALQRASLTPHARASALSTWLRLVPSAHELSAPRAFTAIRRRLLAKRSLTAPDADALAAFALACARKGHTRNMAGVLATVARVVPPARAAALLARFESKLRGYERLHGVPHDPDYWIGVYSAVVRAQAVTGHSQSALDALARLAASRGHVLPPLFPSPSATPSRPLPADFTALPPSHQLRHLRTALHRASGTLPTPYALASFIRAARASGRTTALSRLRRAAFKHGPRTASWWVLAEMLVARDDGAAAKMLAVFTKYCYAANVPRRALFALAAAQRQARAKEADGDTHTVHPRLWPTPHQTALVWGAIAWAVPDAEVPVLYDTLLALASKTALSSSPSEPPSTSESAPPPATPKRPIDAAHFTPFIALHAHRARPAAAAAVLRDIARLGLRPGDAQWGALVHAHPHAATGATGATTTLRIFDMLERQGQGAGADAGVDVGIGVYTGALRALARAGQVGAARDVEARVRARFGYVDGSRAATDRAIEVLRAAERGVGGETMRGRAGTAVPGEVTPGADEGYTELMGLTS